MAQASEAASANVPGRGAMALRVVLILSCVFTMLLSLPLWLNSREYPLLPMAAWVPIFPAPWDAVLLSLALLALVLSIRFEWGTIGFLALSALIVAQDQNRLQPWFYMYWLLILLTVFPKAGALTAARLVLSAVYIWAGLSKCNALFFSEVAPFFITPLAKPFPPSMTPLVSFAVSITPVVEALIGLGLWNRRARPFAMGAAIVMHAATLFVLGPWGHKFNMVVWPWNISMVALIFALFKLGPDEPFASLKASPSRTAVAALVCALPILGRMGHWDAYLSFSLYSGDTPRATLIVSPETTARMPEGMQKYATPNGFDFRNWGEAVLKAPPIPEVRSYLAVAKFIRDKHAPKPDHVQLILQRRPGKTEYLKGSELDAAR
jgi:hypothetical protein